MCHNSQETLPSENALRASIDANTGIATVQPVSQSEVRCINIIFDEVVESLGKPDLGSISTKREIDDRFLTTFAIVMHDDEDNGYGLTTIRQCSKAIDWNYGYEFSTIEQREDEALRSKFRLNMDGLDSGPAAPCTEAHIKDSMDEHVCMDVDGFWLQIGQMKDLTEQVVSYSKILAYHPEPFLLVTSGSATAQ